MSDPSSKPPRRIACVRCRRTKKKCDHAVPVCGQCRRAGAECRQLRTQRTGDYITVPFSYYQSLEAKACAASSPAGHGQESNVPAWSPSPANAHNPPTPPSVDNGRTGQTPDPETSWSGSYPAGPAVGMPEDNLAVPAEGSSQAWAASHMNPPYEASPSLFSGNGGFQTPAPEPQDTEDAGLEITWSIELYANIYLAHVHKMYPFLREGSIRSWMRTCARGHTLDGDHKGFILRLLCAIGAFMCSSFADGCPHLKEATSLSQEAFGRFHAGAMRRGRAIRSQVCLLALFHAIYGPQPELIHEASASALAECAQILEWGSQKESRSKGSATMSDAQSAPGELEDEDDHDEHTSNIVLACHQVNEILACGWDRSAEDLPQLLDDKLSACGDRLSLSRTSGPTHLRPYYNLRKIQHKIRLFHRAIEQWGLDNEAKNKWKAEIVQDVEDWRASLPQGGDEEGSYAPSTNCYTQKLYDYTICLLHGADPSSIVVEDVYALLAASSDACRKYRAAQASNKGLILRNWNTLVYQFRAGTLLLYCFWATPISLRTPAYYSVDTAVSDCSNTLLDFANRWPPAAVFHEVFMCLVARTPFDAVGETPEAWKFPQDEVAKMDVLLGKLRALRTHKSVLSVIEAIVQWPLGVGVEESDPFLAIGLDPMNVFELGQTAYGADLFSLDL